MRSILLTLAATSLILPTTVYAADFNSINSNNSDTSMKIAQARPKHGKRHGRGDRLEKLQEQLDLSTEQRRQIEQIEQQSETETEDLRQQLEEAHQQMQTLLSSDASTDELRQQHQQMQELHQQLDNNRFETKLQVREILTPEQRTQLAETMQRRWERKGER
ncbi:Spy/CpxP family protein refolding chaperone [Myxosarcina sp. GI1]|uniref:Spy/CpxP family protein refolding chaperone n=1 Tax=Myxosarcina sp. GI1 TaxID=1541065 RepID=UPI0005606C06|nr:Spy/CpxP family protein refolding chaperone [Myxosarcina sp. GI1]